MLKVHAAREPGPKYRALGMAQHLEEEREYQGDFMKYLVMTLALLASVVACRNGSDNGNDQIASVPYAPSANCLSNTGYDASRWNPYAGAGYFPYPGYSGYNNGYNGINGGFYGAAGICGCPAGTIPVCDNYAGLGCAPDPRGYGQNYPYWNWQQQNQGYGFQYQGFGYMNSNNSCYAGVAQTCRVGSYDCGYGHCYPTSQDFGICVQ